jgi:hypothetical protein
MLCANSKIDRRRIGAEFDQKSAPIIRGALKGKRLAQWLRQIVSPIGATASESAHLDAKKK